MIDFSCKHDVWIRNKDGSMRRMDEPYFENQKIADGTWRVLSDGDSSYLVEGEKEAVVIDSGYGCGNIREYCQTLTDKSVRNIFSTHDHFDHTANNSYFECAYMSENTAKLATIPFPSFEGIVFPRDYKKKIIEDGFVYDLGGRTLEAIYIPDHASGSMAYLDKEKRILFTGDEVTGGFKMINTSVQNVYKEYRKLYDHIEEFDWICPGSQNTIPADVLGKYLKALEDILNGVEGQMGVDIGMPPLVFSKKNKTTDEIIYDRFQARPGDAKVGEDAKRGEENKRTYVFEGIRIIYDCTKIND